MTPAERQRSKRAQDAAKAHTDIPGLSDSGLLEQLAAAFRKDRASIRDGKKRGPDHGLFVKGLTKEVLRRIK
jgi:hypothetical protein